MGTGEEPKDTRMGEAEEWVRGYSSPQTQNLRDLTGPIVSELGYELVDVELVTERGGPIVRLFVDTIPPSDETTGVSIEDCTRVSRRISEVFDIEDPIEGNYRLEVSSPGLYRPLTKRQHFVRATGERVRVVTLDKIDGQRVFVGQLAQIDEEQLYIETDNRSAAIPLTAVRKANLEPLLD